MMGCTKTSVATADSTMSTKGGKRRNHGGPTVSERKDETSQEKRAFGMLGSTYRAQYPMWGCGGYWNFSPKNIDKRGKMKP